MTYRDAETRRSIVRKGPLFPLNSLMYHGIVSAENAYYGLEKVQTDSDFADQVWSYFATGTQLQELYITPSMLNKAKWDTPRRRRNGRVRMPACWWILTGLAVTQLRFRFTAGPHGVKTKRFLAYATRRISRNVTTGFNQRF